MNLKNHKSSLHHGLTAEIVRWATFSLPVVVAVVLAELSLKWVAAFGLLCFMIYYRMLVEKPSLQCSEDMWGVVSLCPSLLASIWHTPWAINGHVQAILFALWPQSNANYRAHCVRFHRELVRLEDGGQVALDWSIVNNSSTEAIPDPSTTETILLTIPGIVGKNGNAYLVRFAQCLHSRTNGRCLLAVKSWRGIDCPLNHIQPRAETWDVQAVEDTLAVAQHIRQKFPMSSIFLIGWSHGGNVAVSAFAREQGASLFKGGVAISAPYDLEKTMSFLEQRQWFPYSFVNTKAMAELYCENNGKDLISSNLDGAKEGFGVVDRMLSWKNLIAHIAIRRPYGSTWHEYITCRYTGHETPCSYYKAVAELVRESMGNVRVPLLCLLSEDDPVTPSETYRHLISVRDESNGVPADALASLSPKVVVAKTKRGGHCGFFHRFLAYSWVDDVIIEFVEGCLKHG